VPQLMMVRATGWMFRRYMPPVDIHIDIETVHLLSVSIYFFCNEVILFSYLQGWGRYFISVLRYKVKKYSEKVTKYK